MIRVFTKADTISVANLIKDTFLKYNADDYFDIRGASDTLDYFDADKHSEDELYNTFGLSEIFFVYEISGEIAGIIRGKKDKISSLYVLENHQGQGIGIALVKAFEEEAIHQGTNIIRINASLYAVEFYEKAGYKKTSDITDFMGLKVYKMEKFIS